MAVAPSGEYQSLLYLSLTRLAVSFDNISADVTVAVAKLDLQYGVAHSSHVLVVTCVKNLSLVGSELWV